MYYRPGEGCPKIDDPQEMKEGYEHLNPIIFWKFSPYQSQISTHTHTHTHTHNSILAQKFYGITYHTAPL